MTEVLSIDLGTSGCRSAVYDETLTMLQSAKIDFPLIVRSDTEIEQSAEVWWDAVHQTITALAQKRSLKDVCAVSISSQGISLLPVGRDGEILQDAISWLDSRATQEEAQLRRDVGATALYEKTGLILSPLYSLPKMMWMQKNLAQVMERAHKVLLPMDYILFRLCGRMVTDHTMAAGTMLYNLSTRSWDDDLLALCGAKKELLSEIMPSGAAAGTILPEVAKELGLSTDTVIAVGAQDQKCAAYGAGAGLDTASASIGTCTCISKLTDTLPLDADCGIPCFAYIKEDMWDLEGIINTTGSALQWFRDQFAANRSFKELDALAGEQPGPCAVKFYPNLAGAGSPHWEKGMGMFAELSLSSGVGQCVRAILEGVAFGIRANLDVMDRIGGPTQTLHIFGGGANSTLWCQIIADVIGRKVVQMQSPDTALAGAAKLAMESVGIPPPPSVKHGFTFLPDDTRRAQYDVAYREYENFRTRAFGLARKGKPDN